MSGHMDCDGTLDWNEKAAQEHRQEMLARRRALEAERVEREAANARAFKEHVERYGDMLIGVD